MALRLPKAQLPAELSENMIKGFGTTLEPVEAVWHNPGVATANLDFSRRIAEWDALDEGLKSFAHVTPPPRERGGFSLTLPGVATGQPGPENVDGSHRVGVRPVGAAGAVEGVLGGPVLRRNMPACGARPGGVAGVHGDRFPPGAHLLDELGPAAMVELTAYVAFVNMATRNNTANGVRSQGFSDSCEIPPARRTTAGDAPAGASPA